MASAFGRMARNRFGRSNERTKILGRRTNSFSAISARVGSSAVAVTAIIWTPWKRFRDLAQAQIFRAEIVAPLRDAMRLVDGEKIDLSLPQGGDRVVAQQPFGRDVEKPQRSLVEATRDPPAFVGIGRGIEARRLDAGLAQLGDLVAHQRDQRRNHQE